MNGDALIRGLPVHNTKSASLGKCSGLDSQEKTQLKSEAYFVLFFLQYKSIAFARLTVAKVVT